MGKIERLAAERGVNADQMVMEALGKYKTVYAAAAIEFQCSPNTLFMWLRRHGYKPTTTREWKKQEAETA